MPGLDRIRTCNQHSGTIIVVLGWTALGLLASLRVGNSTNEGRYRSSGKLQIVLFAQMPQNVNTNAACNIRWVCVVVIPPAAIYPPSPVTYCHCIPSILHICWRFVKVLQKWNILILFYVNMTPTKGGNVSRINNPINYRVWWDHNISGCAPTGWWNIHGSRAFYHS
jgi:hypothetical protein